MGLATLQKHEHMTHSTSPHIPAPTIDVISDGGSGRAFITIIDDGAYLPLARNVVDKLASKARSVLLQASPVTNTSWESLTEVFSATLANLNVRQASVIGMGAGATIAQNFALAHPKSVRSLAIVDASSRPHPTRWERLVDWIEERLPFGLPLRLGSEGFNVKAYLHRLRCPLLVIATTRASAFVREEIKSAALRAPTAWRVVLSGGEEEQSVQLSEALLAFQDTPAKCPQKNVREG